MNKSEYTFNHGSRNSSQGRVEITNQGKLIEVYQEEARPYEPPLWKSEVDENLDIVSTAQTDIVATGQASQEVICDTPGK